MDTTFAAVCDLARAQLNDTDVSGGEIFTNSMLQLHREQAYRELYSAMSTMQVPDINRTVYWVVPAHTTRLSPQFQMGLNDFSEPVFVEERGNITVVNVTSTSNTAPIVVTTSLPHGLADNQNITIQGVTGTMAPWGRWYITVINNISFSLISSFGDGSIGAGGTACYGQDPFTEVVPLLRTTDRAESDILYDYIWQDGMLLFRGASQVREIRITYRASGDPPSSTSVQLGLDDALNFLGTRTASLAAAQKQWIPTYERLARISCGPKMEPDGSGGQLRNFVNNMVVAMQRNQRQRRSFRPRRNVPDWYLL